MRNTNTIFTINDWVKVVFCMSLLAIMVVKPVHSQEMPHSSEFYTIASKMFSGMNIEQVEQDPPLLKKTISVEYQNITLKEALEDIAEEGGFKLSYSENLVPLTKVVSLSLQEVTINEVLWRVLEGTELRFALSPNKHLVLMRQQDFKNADEVVQGTVTDGSGDVLPGVNITVKETTRGTTTDPQGNYELMVPSLQDTLVFSFIGLQTQEIPIQGRTEIDVQMQSEAVFGEEVVVVGYGEQRKISLIGSQSSVQGKDVEALEVSSGSLTNSLAGRLSGVVGVQRSGLPGADASDIWIRGISTFGDSSPLILVDGIERPMNSLNPDDIESLTVLKDASATAVYGTRGANGVIIIETKEGTAGAPTINVDFFQGVTELTKVPEMVDGPTYMRLANEARTTRGQPALYTEEEIQMTENGTNPLIYPNVDWMDTIFNDYGQNRQFNARVNGGSENTQYYVSLSYYNERGLLVNNDTTDYSTNTNYNKYNLQSNVTLDVTPTTQAKLGVGGYLEDRQYPSVGVDGIFSQAMEASPVAYPIIYPNGYTPGRNPNGGERNPYTDATGRGYSDAFNSQLFSTLELTQELDMLVEGLSLKGLFGFDTYSESSVNRGKRPNTYYIDPSDPYDVDGTYNYNLTYEGNNTLGYDPDNDGNREYYLETSLQYRNDFGTRHQVSGLLVYNQSDEQGASADNFTESIPHREQSAAIRATYSYDDRYFLEANFGYSGSENFASENRFGFFPSAGMGWVISNEEFFEPLSGAIDFLKVRYSDGFVGASADAGGNRFAYMTQLNTYDNAYSYGLNRNGRNGIEISSYGVNVQWAEARKQDLGIEIRTLDNQLSLTVDFFKERRDGIFLSRASVPNFVGLVSDPVANVGVIENKGFDGQIQYSGRIGDDFSLGLQGQFTYNRDEIIENDQPSQPYPWMSFRGENRLSNHGYVADGLFESQEEIDNHARQFGTVMPGDIKYRDLNDDGVINAFDQKKISRGDVPYLTLGTGISMGYKAFDLQAFFQGQFGAQDLIGGSSIQPFQGGGGRGNLYAKATDRWTEENPDPDAFYPRLAYGDAENSNNFRESSYWVRDLDFVRMKEMEVGYTLPLSIIGNTTVSSARLYLRGRNLLMFSDFELWDPELNTSNGTSYPNTRVYAIGFDIEF